MAYHFNTRIEIFEKQESWGPEAGFSTNVTIARPWADIKTMKGTEYEIWQLTANEAPIRFIIRYRKGINANQYVKYNGKTYNIKSVANDNGKNQTLTIFASTVE
ncbi:phage head closure protein [Staphylococcus nepalensis]|uniref:phage head closure protein n=1 Tax=Staphylococcus nepalensis TaxID=214473 RepID=UPI000E697FEC|nr:phage head closure protein [Staphylococcus nepalensis]RIO42096.1 head-tail adaptor protein [Staphylococcus nepalensis]